jgi:hypothetical protein
MPVRYFGSFMTGVEDTSLITVPVIAAEQHKREPRTHIEPSPFKSQPVPILISWQLSTDGEPALQWFRGQVRKIAGQLA